MLNNCIDCKWIGGILKVKGYKDSGRCHKFPPQSHVSRSEGHVEYESRLPWVNDGDWCSFFEPQEPPDEAGK